MASFNLKNESIFSQTSTITIDSRYCRLYISNGNLEQNFFLHFAYTSKMYQSVRKTSFLQSKKPKISISALI
jgi:hypothetical protein